MNHEPLKNKLVDKYPEDIFIEPTKEQWDKIHELCNKEIGKPFDGFAGSISRHVLRNCIEDVKSAVEGLKKDIINERKAVSKPSINDWEKGYLCGLDFAFQSIKIWFEDVIR